MGCMYIQYNQMRTLLLHLSSSEDELHSGYSNIPEKRHSILGLFSTESHILSRQVTSWLEPFAIFETCQAEIFQKELSMSIKIDLFLYELSTGLPKFNCVPL